MSRAASMSAIDMRRVTDFVAPRITGSRLILPSFWAFRKRSVMTSGWASHQSASSFSDLNLGIAVLVVYIRLRVKDKGRELRAREPEARSIYFRRSLLPT